MEMSFRVSPRFKVLIQKMMVSFKGKLLLESDRNIVVAKEREGKTTDENAAKSYNYNALDEKGAETKGVVVAETQAQAVSLIYQMGLYPIHISLNRDVQQTKSPKNANSGFSPETLAATQSEVIIHKCRDGQNNGEVAVRTVAESAVTDHVILEHKAELEEVVVDSVSVSEDEIDKLVAGCKSTFMKCQAGSNTDLSEWQFPDKMRSLVAQLEAELIGPARALIKKANRKYKEESEGARAIFSESEASYRMIVEKAESSLSDSKAQFETLEKRLAETFHGINLDVDDIGKCVHTLLSDATARMRSLEVSFPPKRESQWAASSKQISPTAISCCARAREELDIAQKYYDTLLKAERPKNSVWPDRDWIGCSGVISAVIATSIIGGLFHSFFLKFVFFVSCYAIFIILARIVSNSGLRGCFHNLRKYCFFAEESSAECLSRAKEEYESAVAMVRSNLSAAEKEFRRIENEANGKNLAPAKCKYDKALKVIEARHSARMRAIEVLLLPIAERLHNEFNAFWTKTGFAGADWSDPSWCDWIPDPSPGFAARVGKLTVESRGLKESFPSINWIFSLPALIPFAEGRCFLSRATGKAKDTAAEALQSVVIRALANTPAGKARFTLIDPVGIGYNVADFMHLGDYNSELINGKAWTEPQHIEQQLIKLTEVMETVIQTYLRKNYTSIQEYNKEHNEVAEPYRFLVIFDFPVNFTESAARRLVSIVKNGPRCGVFTLMLQDTAKTLPYGFTGQELEEAATQIAMIGGASGSGMAIGGFVWKELEFEGYSLELDVAPPQAVSCAIIKKSGEMSAEGMKKAFLFGKMVAATQKKDSWLGSSTSSNLRVPLGPAGKGILQELTLGGGQEAHALLVGRTGSGKTNLMHVIITNLALTYSPSELQLYLIDFKGGVGFKRYAEHRLPHAKVIAIESEREFGMSVLRGLDEMLKRRSEVFRAAGVDNLAAYRAKSQTGTFLPRILLVVDEFQEFFTENDEISQQAKIIFDRLARQGRSFGLHFLLATQSLAGSAQLPASIMGQIKVRISLACSESDSRLIFADDNKAARSLSQAGEAIYNSMGGLVDGNSKFQVAHFNEDTDLQNYLKMVSDMAYAQNIIAAPIVFEGNELARTEDCEPLKELIAAQDWQQPAKIVDIFLGEPIAILPPVTARLRRQSGSNIMVITREESEGVGMCVSALISILVQQRARTCQVYIADFTTADSDWSEHAEEIARSFPGDIAVVGRQGEVGALFATVAEEVRLRGEKATGMGRIFLVLQGIHRIRSLRENTDDFNGHNSVELLQTILRDGPEVGVHVIAWSDILANAMRGLGRRAINEFGLRIGGAMSSEESMSFFDSLVASKLSKPHRAIFSDEDRPGQVLTFRPYAMPSAAWLRQTGQQLMARVNDRSANH